MSQNCVSSSTNSLLLCFCRLTMMPRTFHTRIFPDRKWINFATVAGLLYMRRVLRLSKKMNFCSDGTAMIAWSMLNDRSLKLSGLPMKRQSSVFSIFPPLVWVIASIKITMSLLMPALLSSCLTVV